MFVVCEGIDGSGKTTQAKLLAKRVGAELFTYPDRETPIGRLINRWLKGQVTLAKHAKTTGTESGIELPDVEYLTGDADAGLCLQGLMLANKIEVQPYLLRALVRNHSWVVADRYSPSAVAYGTADGLDPEWLYDSHDSLVKPDLYILLDVTVEMAVSRREKQGGGEHYEADRNRLARARAKYRQMAQYERTQHDWAIVNGMQPVADVADIIFKLVMMNKPPETP